VKTTSVRTIVHAWVKTSVNAHQITLETTAIRQVRN